MNANSERTQSNEHNSRTGLNDSHMNNENEEFNFPQVSSNKRKRIKPIHVNDDVSTNRTTKLLGKKTKIFEIKKVMRKKFTNRDDALKGAIKALIPYLAKLVEKLSGKKLKRVNLNKIVGGMKDNRVVLGMTLEEILSKNTENVEILKNLSSKHEFSLDFLLKSTYKTLFYKYYENDEAIMDENGKKIKNISFPTFNKVLTDRNKRYYKNDQEKIQYFKDATEEIKNDFYGKQGRIRKLKNVKYSKNESKALNISSISEHNIVQQSLFQDEDLRKQSHNLSNISSDEFINFPYPNFQFINLPDNSDDNTGNNTDNNNISMDDFSLERINSFDQYDKLFLI